MTSITSPTIATPETTAGSPVTRLLAACASGRDVPSDLFTDDVAFDAVVPNWRFPLSGATPVARQMAEWFRFDAPASYQELKRLATADGEVVGFTITWIESGVPHAARQSWHIMVDGHRISGLELWCGGRWPADLLASMEAAHAGRQP